MLKEWCEMLFIVISFWCFLGIILHWKDLESCSHMMISMWALTHLPLVLHIYVSELGHLWFNSLWPSDAIWWYRRGSTLAQVMACCLMAPSHYLNQCWLIISEVLWHSPDGNFTWNAQDIYPWREFEITNLSLHPQVPGTNELNNCLLPVRHQAII